MSISKSMGNIMVLLGLVVLATAIGMPGNAGAGSCPGLNGGVEAFGPLNQAPHDVSVVGHLAYTADLYGMTVYDISDPHNPAKVAEVLLPERALGIFVAGATAYVADAFHGLQIVDISDPAHPELVGAYDAGGEVNDVAVSGSIAYLAAGSSGLRIVDISDPANPTALGAYTTKVNAKGLTVSGSVVYVAAGNYGLILIDISDPSSPALLGELNTNGSSYDVALSGSTAFVADFRSGLQVIDVSNPAEPASLGSADTPGYAYGVILSGDYAYIADGPQGLQIVDISDPMNPSLVGAKVLQGNFKGIDVTGDTAFLANTDGTLEIIDVADPVVPALLGTFDAQGITRGLIVDRSTVFVANGNAGLQTIDVSDPVNPVLLGSCGEETRAYEVAVSGDVAYVANANHGLWTVDVSDPARPATLGSCDTPGSAYGVFVSGNLAYVADGGSGLEIIDVSDPASPVLLGSLDTPGWALDVQVAANLAYVADSKKGLRIIDVSNPSSPTSIGFIDTDGEAKSLAVSGDIAYIADLKGGLKIVDVSDPTSPELVASYATPGWTLHITVSGTVVYMTIAGIGIEMVDVSDPASPQRIALIETSKIPVTLAMDPDTGTAWVGEWAIVEGMTVTCAACPTIEVTASPGSITAGGSTSTITVTLEDGNGSPMPGKALTGACTGGDVSAFTDKGDGSYTATFTSGTAVGWADIVVSVDGTSCDGSGQIHVTFPSNPPLDDQLPQHLAVIPGSAHVSGAGGTAWRSDAVFHNPGTRDASLALFFLETGKDNTGITGHVFSVPAGTSLALNDIVEKTFGTSASGAILAASGEPLLITSRTYNDVSSGTYGQFVPGLALLKAIGSREKVRLIQLSRNSHFRTNIGFANASASELHVTVELREADGTPIASPEYTIPPWSFYQKTRILTSDVDDAFAIVSSKDPDARYFTYASVVDNDSGDPTFVQPVPGTEGVLIVPASAHVKGAAGTNWRSDLEVHAPESSRIYFKIDLLERNKENSSPLSSDFHLEAGQSMRFVDILDSVFHFSGAAALRITASWGPAMVTSRTYNDVAGGTYGQFIPARPASFGAGIAKEARLLQLSQSTDTKAGYRTNIGLTNTTANTIEVTVALYDGDGNALGTVTETLKAYEFVQIDKIFQKVTQDAVVNGYAIVSSSTQGAGFFAYASVVDNRSGDPVNVPALR